VARGVDGLLVGWLAVAVWLAVYAVQHVDNSAGFPGLNLVYWTGVVITSAHFGLSYHLAYSGGAPAVRARPFVLVWAPAALIGVLAVLTLVSLGAGVQVTSRTTGALITSVYLLTTWHYVKQVYGVARIGAAYGSVKLSKSDANVLRYGLYPLWFLGASQVLVSSSYRLSGFAVGFDVLPGWTRTLLRVIALLSALPIAAVFVRASRQTRRFPPSAFLAPYVAAFLWLGLPTNPGLSILLLAPFHALQYLAVGHRAEIAVARDRAGQHGVMWWLNIFVGAACGGLLLSRWAPNLLDTHIHSDSGPLLFAAAFFVFLNMHHYLIDASIWRSSGELVKAMGRKPGATAPAPELVSP
jgi:hypothetical protein